MLTYDLDRRGKLARYDYLYRCIREDILAGRLTAGEKLPSKRSLASHLQTAVITVQNAYAQLEAEGYLYTREKRGYYVADVERHPAAPGRAPARSAPQPQRSWLLDLSSGGSGTEDFPFSVWAKLMRRVLSEEGEALLRATPPNGADAPSRSISTASAASPPRRSRSSSARERSTSITSSSSCSDARPSTAWRTPATPRPRASTRSAAQGLRPCLWMRAA